MLERDTLYNTTRPFVDVRAYGAVGDGVTDDTAALQRAADDAKAKGMDLKFTGGTYLISKQIAFNGWQDARVYADKAVIVAAASYKRSASLEGMLEFNNSNNIKLFGFAIDGSEPKMPANEMFLHAIRFKNSHNAEVAFNTTTNTVGNGLNFSDSDNPVVHHNTIDKYWHGGIEFKRSTNIYVADNTITGTGDKGTTASMTNNRKSGGTSGILITGTATGGDPTLEPPHSGAIVQRNSIRNSSGGGIKIEDQNKVQVLFNEVHGFGKDGIKVHPINQKANPAAFVSDAVIRGNTLSGFKNWRGDGSGYIVLQSVRGGLVEDNLILGNEGKAPAVVPTWKYEYGVRVNPFLGWGKRPENVVVRGNRIYGTREPISLQGGATTLTQSGNTIAAAIPANIMKPVDDGSTPTLPGGGGTDTVDGGTPPVEPITLSGGNGADFLRGNSKNNTLSGGAGSDTLSGGAGGDVVNGDGGNDVLYGDEPLVDTITVRASSDSLDGQGAQFRVLLDGKQVGNIQEVTAVRSAGQIQTFTFTLHSPMAARKLAVEFLNDAYQGEGKDRNLWVDTVQLGGRALDIPGAQYLVQDESTPRPGSQNIFRNGTLNFALSDGTAGNDSLDGGLGDDALFGGDGDDVLTAGSLIPAAAGTGGASQEIIVRIAGDQYNGAPQFDLFIDGQVVKAGNAVTALAKEGQVQVFHFTVDADFSKAKTLGLRMTNDAWGGKGKDRNLYVREIRIGDMVLDGTAARYAEKGESTGRSIFRRGVNFLSGGGMLSYALPAELGDNARPGTPEKNTLDGGRGSDTLLGSAGNDNYQFGAGGDTDLLNNQGGNGDTTDTLLFGEGVAVHQLRFWRTGSDLRIGIMGTTDSVQLKDWYGDNDNARIDQFLTADGRSLAAGDVQQLVDAMNGFEATTAEGNILPLPEGILNAVESVLAAVWK